MTDSGSTPKQIPAAAALKAFVPLGIYTQESWSPLGAGVLLADAPVAWLVTSRRLLEAASEAPLAAFVERAGNTEVIDLNETLATSGLEWVEDSEHGVAACLFPLDPALGLQGFGQRECAAAHELTPFLPVSSLGSPYGSTLDFTRPIPMMFDGVLSHVDAEASRLHTTAPLLPNNMGAPLVLTFGLGGPLKLLGILTETLLVPEPEPDVPPVRISRAVSAEPLWDLVRCEEARAQRLKVLTEATAGDGQRAAGADAAEGGSSG